MGEWLAGWLAGWPEHAPQRLRRERSLAVQELTVQRAQLLVEVQREPADREIPLTPSTHSLLSSSLDPEGLTAAYTWCTR